jgi:hypothetical protein
MERRKAFRAEKVDVIIDDDEGLTSFCASGVDSDFCVARDPEEMIYIVNFVINPLGFTQKLYPIHGATTVFRFILRMKNIFPQSTKRKK